MKRLVSILSIFLCLAYFVQAQDIENAQKIFRQLKQGQGDSVYALCDAEVKKVISSDALGKTFTQLEKQFGHLQDESDWKQQEAQGMAIITATLSFEKVTLLFIIAFNKNGEISTLRFTPKSQKQTLTPLSERPAGVNESDITIKTGKFTLPGTLCMPENKENIPIVIFIHGSGPNDRNETIGPNAIFRDLAYGLALNGIASIRYDKRTFVYGSNILAEGQKLTPEPETIEDAISAVEVAKTINGIDTSKIILIGHSLGAMCAPRIAKRCEDLKGCIMLAGNARPLEDLLPEQIEYIVSLDGISEEDKKQINVIKEQVKNVKALGTPFYKKSVGLPLNLPESYWSYYNQYKQTEEALSISQPLFILQGERDYQVTMNDFLLWKSALFKKKNADFKSYPLLNHLFLEGTGKSTPFEYNTASKIPDYVINDITNWIQKQ